MPDEIPIESRQKIAAASSPLEAAMAVISVLDHKQKREILGLAVGLLAAQKNSTPEQRDACQQAFNFLLYSDGEKTHA